jgi:hypothetical protein
VVTVDVGLIIVVILLNATIPLSIWWWRTVSRDEDLARRIPARSGGPLFLALPLAFDVGLLASAIPGGGFDAGAGAVLCAAILLILSTWIVRFPAWAIPPKLRHPGHVKHDLGVYYVDDTHGATEPYYVAICSCGWNGDTFDDRHRAELQAKRHRPVVDPQLRIPGDVRSK